MCTHRNPCLRWHQGYLKQDKTEERAQTHKERKFSVLFVLITKELAFLLYSSFKESTYLIKTKAKPSKLVLRKKN